MGLYGCVNVWLFVAFSRKNYFKDLFEILQLFSLDTEYDIGFKLCKNSIQFHYNLGIIVVFCIVMWLTVDVTTVCLPDLFF